MEVGVTQPRKRLAEYLPAIYQEPGLHGGPSFLARFLLAFDRLLLEGDWEKSDLEAEAEGYVCEEEPLERKIRRLHLFFNAEETPEEFLSWLAGWSALSFRAELSVDRRRKLLAAMISLYRIRGTRAYLQEILRICLDAIATVSDQELPALKIGSTSHVGADTHLRGGPPHFFRVQLIAPKLDPAALKIQIRLAASLIDLNKPAHTYYEVEVISRRMQIGVFSSVGLDTILGPDTA